MRERESPFSSPHIKPAGSREEAEKDDGVAFSSTTYDPENGQVTVQWGRMEGCRWREILKEYEKLREELSRLAKEQEVLVSGPELQTRIGR